MSRAVVVVPCYNEARRLNLAELQDFAQRSRHAELLFVNDGSRDNTLELLAVLERRHPRALRVISLPQNSGKAEAVRRGVLTALESRPDYVGFWDADLATPLSDIENFCRVLDAKPHLELVIGTRLRLLGHRIERQPLRYWLGRLFANTASLALGVRVFDTQCGAKLFRVTRRLEQVFARPFATRWIFDVEIFARLLALHRHSAVDEIVPHLADALYEYPLDAWREVRGSAVRSGDFAKASLELAGIYWRYLRPGAPPLALPEAQPGDSRPGRRAA